MIKINFYPLTLSITIPIKLKEALLCLINQLGHMQFNYLE